MRKAEAVLLDTNVILRYLMRDHEEMYERADQLLEQIRVGGRGAILLEGVVMETIYVLTKFYDVPRAKAAEKLQAILRYKGIRNTDKDDLLAALDIFAHKRIDFVDCIICAKSRAGDMEVFSFDKHVKMSSRSMDDRSPPPKSEEERRE